MNNRELANNLVQKICSELQIVPSEKSWKKMVDVAEKFVAAQHLLALDLAVCAPDLHESLDDQGFLYCGYCGLPLGK